MAKTREQIIQTTCGLIEAQGYHATGLKQILEESGTPKGSLYYYFPAGKEELADEAIQHVSKKIQERIRVALDEFTEPAAAVRAFIEELAQRVEASGYQKGGPITTIALETATTNERLNSACGQAYRLWESAFQAKLAQHGFAEETATQLASLIIAAIEGGIILSRTYKSKDPLLAVAEQVSRLVEHAQ
jgi:TetR/AcrR family transcriptional repressor of lmrAB and yxaGH operons